MVIKFMLYNLNGSLIYAYLSMLHVQAKEYLNGRDTNIQAVSDPSLSYVHC